MDINNKRVVIDIDGTICEEKPLHEKIFARPLPNAVESVNKISENNFVMLYTARCWSQYKITKKWLDDNGVKYDVLICGKPIYDIWIDDRAIKFTSWEKELKT